MDGWNSAQHIPISTSAADFDDLIDGAPVFGGDSNEEERDDQVKAARAAAKAIIKGGVLGKQKAYGWTVEMAGHANPDSVQQVGNVRDWVSLKITQEGA